MNLEILIATSSIFAITRLINQINERKFCRTQQPEKIASYIEVLKAKKNNESSVLRRLPGRVKRIKTESS